MMVVEMQPAMKLAAPFGLGGIAADGGPAVSQSAVKGPYLSIGLRPTQPGGLVLDAELCAGVSPQV